MIFSFHADVFFRSCRFFENVLFSLLHENCLQNSQKQSSVLSLFSWYDAISYKLFLVLVWHPENKILPLKMRY